MKNSGSPFKKVKGPKRWILLLVVIGVAALALYQVWGFTQKRSGTQRVARTEIPVQISPVVRKDLTYSLSATGDIAPLMQVDLFPRVSGYLDRINVNLGDSVRQGQVIAQIDQADFVQKVKEGEAKVAMRRPSSPSSKQAQGLKNCARRRKRSVKPNPVLIMPNYTVKGLTPYSKNKSCQKRRWILLTWNTRSLRRNWQVANNI